MALVNPLQFIIQAQKKGKAIAAFNIHNLETIQAVDEAAGEERAPVIIQATPGTLKHAGIPYICSIVKTASELHNVPIALHVDHCESFKTIVQCIQNGFTSVMIDGSKLDYLENVKLVRKVVEVAHSAGVAVEAELGKIGGTEDDLFISDREASFTVPEEAKMFVDETGIDSLAIAIGTAHGVYKGEPKLDFERLSSIRSMLQLPLVLHGASGVPDKSIIEAVSRGICKINIATELKIPMADAIKKCFENNKEENDPRKYMGAAKAAVKEAARYKIRLCGANGLADEIGDFR